jgi:hypothetical protein
MGSVLPDNNDKKLYTLSSCAARGAPDHGIARQSEGRSSTRIEERESLLKKRTGKRGSARLSCFADLGHKD